LIAAASGDTQQFGIAQLLHARHAVINFGDLIRLDKAVDHLADLGSLAWVTATFDTAAPTAALISAASRALVTS
jgi:hypothetical protein